MKLDLKIPRYLLSECLTYRIKKIRPRTRHVVCKRLRFCSVPVSNVVYIVIHTLHSMHRKMQHLVIGL
ncbi:uncharacterized protein BJ212DRAFT_1333105, partial [Suillus subaureus]